MALFLAGAITYSCREDPTTWSTESRSPDGRWIVRAHTVQHSGPGANGVETIVEIKQDSWINRPIMVLGFSDDGASLALAVKWKDSSNLGVTYHDDPSLLYFQVLKTSGVNINLQNTQGQ